MTYICFWGEGGRAKIGTSSGWQVSHPLGTPHLVLIRTTIVVYCNSFDSVENLKSAKYFRFSKISNFYIFEIRTFIIHTFAITPNNIPHLVQSNILVGSAFFCELVLLSLMALVILSILM